MYEQFVYIWHVSIIHLFRYQVVTYLYLLEYTKLCSHIERLDQFWAKEAAQNTYKTVTPRDAPNCSVIRQLRLIAKTSRSRAVSPLF